MVLDASAVVEWLLGLPLAAAVGSRIADPDQTLHAPHLLGIEVAQVVRRYVARGEVTPGRGAEAIADLADLDLVHHPHEPLLPAIWQLRSNLAAYVALAEALEAPLVTLDGRIAAAPGHAAVVDLVC